MGDTLDFQRDFQIYAELIARSASGRNAKTFEAANHRCRPLCIPAGFVASGEGAVAQAAP